MADEIVRYKGREYKLKFLGQTQYGRKAKLAFMDGTSEFWVLADKISAAPEVAARLNAAQAEKQQAAAAKQQFAQASIAASKATTSTFEIPRSEEVIARQLDYLPFQKAGIEYASKHKDCLVADEMGLGKTIQAVGVINSDPTIRNVLVICPASVKLNWRRELRLWLARELPVLFANGQFPTLPATGGVVIINYEMISKYRPAIDAISWDLLVADECHYVKNPKAQRTIALLGRWNPDAAKTVKPVAARRRVFLTGTPVLNRPIELWTICHALDPWGLGRKWQAYTERYCDAHQDKWGWVTDGASNLDELQGKLRAAFMVRRLKSEVLTELPAKRRQIIVLEPATPEAKAAVAAETKKEAEYRAKVEALRAEVERLSVDEASDAYRAASAALRQAESVHFTEMSAERHRVAVAKVPQVIEHVLDCLEAEQKLVIFAHHHDVIDAIAKGLSGLSEDGVITADGRNSVEERQAAVDRFQNDHNCRVIICGINSMGTGHTLTAASHVIFAELSWVPGELQQAEDRLHRIGQKDSVLVQHLVLDGSLDATMAQRLVAKQEVISKALDNGGHLPESKPVEVINVAAAQPVLFEHTPVAVRTLEPGELPLEQVKAIHLALKMLARVCDGAVAKDDVGFNGTDQEFGHQLAAQEWGLTQKQAKAAQRMLLKYHRQLPEDLYAQVKGEKSDT